MMKISSIPCTFYTVGVKSIQTLVNFVDVCLDLAICNYGPHDLVLGNILFLEKTGKFTLFTKNR